MNKTIHNFEQSINEGANASVDTSLLKTVLSIPSYVAHEEMVTAFLVEYGKKMGYAVHTNFKGNVYFQKGNVAEGEFFPCVMAHIDMVHHNDEKLIKAGWKKKIMQDGDILYAVHPKTGERIGIGGDDLAGVYIALRVMESFPAIKGAFFVQEEPGCNGSRNADPKFFENVGYGVQFDGPEDNWISHTLMGRRVYSDEFLEIAKPVLDKFGQTNFSKDPYTDTFFISQTFGICVINVTAGYFEYHRPTEYVKIAAVHNGMELGKELISTFGNTKHILTIDQATKRDDKKSNW